MTARPLHWLQAFSRRQSLENIPGASKGTTGWAIPSRSNPVFRASNSPNRPGISAQIASRPALAECCPLIVEDRSCQTTITDLRPRTRRLPARREAARPSTGYWASPSWWFSPSCSLPGGRPGHRTGWRVSLHQPQCLMPRRQRRPHRACLRHHSSNPRPTRGAAAHPARGASAPACNGARL